ncbi:hypothetical protein HRbin28_01491 [bacterium HR28]|nr:hypothetical protein HRbin28_01491 [bacterium HR28]
MPSTVSASGPRLGDQGVMNRLEAPGPVMYTTRRPSASALSRQTVGSEGHAQVSRASAPPPRHAPIECDQGWQRPRTCTRRIAHVQNRVATGHIALRDTTVRTSATYRRGLQGPAGAGVFRQSNDETATFWSAQDRCAGAERAHQRRAHLVCAQCCHESEVLQGLASTAGDRSRGRGWPCIKALCR